MVCRLAAAGRPVGMALKPQRSGLATMDLCDRLGCEHDRVDRALAAHVRPAQSALARIVVDRV